MTSEKTIVAEIRDDVRAIRAEQASIWRSFRNGMFYGAGAIVGTILAATLISYILSLFGVIPGFGDIASFIRSSLESIRATRV